jgi:HSP20 family molecular chaperone IbpA
MNNRRNLTRSLTTIDLLGLLGTAGAATYAAQTAGEQAAAGGKPLRTARQTSGTEVAPAYDTWDPRLEMHRMQEGIDSLFAESWARMHMEMAGLPPLSTAPSQSEVTLQDEPNDYLVTAKLPGVEEGDLNVSLDGRLLRISAQRQVQEADTADNGQVLREQNYTSSIQRAFTLPGPVEASKMHTQFGDGVLTVTIPKAAS